MNEVKYDPECAISQSYLAGEVLVRLVRCGFKEIDPGPKCMERVFERPRNDDADIRVVVFTSIHKTKGLVRGKGHDAIRVCLVRRTKNGTDRGLVKAKRVNRVGLVSAICDRMHERMRDCWRALRDVKSCHNCDSPMFITKKGKPCCSELCFKNKSAYKAKPSRAGHGRRHQTSATMQNRNY